jgi:pilus assembly protein TadC
MTWAALLLAAALVVGGDSSRVRMRAGLSAAVRRRSAASPPNDPLAAASSFDVFAACLRSGMAVSTAAAATASSAPLPLARVLRRAADMLMLGADPMTAWSTHGLQGDDHVDALLRSARRSATSGTALADGIAELAEQSRREAANAADATAQRASVLIAGPLGLCYLPAFVCLGIVPVVAGLAGDVLQSGVI